MRSEGDEMTDWDMCPAAERVPANSAASGHSQARELRRAARGYFNSMAQQFFHVLYSTHAVRAYRIRNAPD